MFLFGEKIENSTFLPFLTPQKRNLVGPSETIWPLFHCCPRLSLKSGISAVLSPKVYASTDRHVDHQRQIQISMSRLPESGNQTETLLLTTNHISVCAEPNRQQTLSRQLSTKQQETRDP